MSLKYIPLLVICVVFLTQLQFAVPTQGTPILNSTNGSLAYNTSNLTAYNQSTQGATMNIYRWHKNGVMNATMPNPFYDVGSNNTTQGLVGYWPLNNDTNDFALGNDGVVSGGLNCSTAVTGKIGSACDFDGTDDHILVNEGNVTSGTVSMWINKNGDQITYATLFSSMEGSGGANGYHITFSADEKVVLYINNVLKASTSFGLLNSVWYHVVVNFNSSESTIYIDGTLDGTAAGGVPTHTSPSKYIGNYISGYRFKGIIDEVAIWNRTLSANEIKALYWGGMTGGSVLNSSLLSNGDNWTVEVTPCDYLECGTPKNSSVLSIMNAPTQGTPLLNSTDYPTNRTTGNLTAWNQSTVQVPGRNVTNIYRWFKNGVLNASMPNPFYDVGSNNTTQGLVLYLPLNNDTKDYAQGNDGTQSGGVNCGTAVAGQIGTACNFTSASSTQITINNFFAGARATSFWFKAPSASTAQGIIGTDASGYNNYDTAIGLNDYNVCTAPGAGKILAESHYPADPTTSNCLVSTTVASNNIWYHVAVTANGTNKSLYINGVLENTNAFIGTLFGSENLHIGYGTNSYRYYTGTIDEVAIWNRTLSANEVKALYYGGVTGGSVLNSSLLSNGDNWTVEVTPCDYLECGTPKNSSTLQLGVAVPTQGTPILNSTNGSLAYNTSNLTAYNQSTQGATMNVYRWHKNGVMNATMPNPFYDVGSNNTTQGLVLYLPFNNDTKDYSGLGNHGTSIAGVDCGIGISGKIGTGCSFPGSHSYINITNGISLNLSTTGALAAWIKTSVSSGHAHIFGKGNWQNDVNGYIFEIYNNNLMVELADASGYQQIQISGVTVANNNWHYVVFTWNDSIYLYMDGASVMTPTARTKTPKSDVYNLWIGDSHVYTSASYSGSMDEVAIWNRTLSANEVKALYYGGVTGGSVLNSSLLSNGDNWTVEVTPCDYLECGTPANSSVLSIMNAPTQGTPLLNSTDYPTNRTTGNLTAWNQSTVQVPGRNVTNIYKWYKNGVLNATMPNPYYDVGSNNTTQGLVGYWPFNNNTNDFALGNDGTQNGGVNCSTSVSGKIGSGCYFDGTDDAIGLSSNSVFTSVGDFSVAAWVRPLDPASVPYRSILAMGTVGDEWLFAFRNGVVIFLSSDLTPVYKAGLTTLSSDIWYHIAFVRTGANYNFYLNGAGDGTGTWSSTVITISGTDRAIGRDSATSGTEIYKGILDDLAVWNRSLSANEIKAIYWGGVTGGNVLNSSLLSAGDQWTVEVTPCDSVSCGTPANSSALTILSGNTAPSVTLVGVLPVVAYKNDTLQCNVTVIDAEQTLLNVTYNWFKDNVNQTALAGVAYHTANGTQTNISNISGLFTKGEKWGCAVLAFDGTDYSPFNYSANVTIQNSVPYVSAQPTFYNFTAGHVFNVSANATDVDGAADIINTFINVSSGTCVYSYNASSGNSFMAVYNCTGTQNASAYINITFRDAAAENTYTDNVFNAYPNHAPSVSGVEITPTPAYSNTSALTCAGDTADSDSDPVTDFYKWFLNGTAIGGQAANTLANTSYHKSDTLICEITPGDIALNGTPVNSSGLQIGNSLPVVFSQPVFSDNNTMHSFNVTATAEDADLGGDIAGATINISSGSCVQVNSTANNLFNVTFICSGSQGATGYLNITFRDITGSIVYTNNVNHAYPNHAPTQGTPLLNSTDYPLNRTIGNLTAWNVSTVDLDNDAVTNVYRWYKNGVLNASMPNPYYDVGSNNTTQGLVGYWPLNNNTGDFALGNDGISTGGANCSASIAGRIGTACEFDGVNDFINESDADILDFGAGQDYTTSAWIKTTFNPTGSIWPMIIRKEGGSPRTGRNIYLNPDTDGKACFDTFVGGSISIVCSVSTVINGDWHLVTGTREGSNYNIFIDGILENTTVGNTGSLANALAQYISGGGPQVWFNGTIDEVAIWNRSLSANEIKALYWGGVTGGNVLNSSLLAKNDNWLVEVALCDAIGCGTPANSSALAIINYAPNVSINLPANGIIANLNISVNYTYNDSEGTSGTCSLIVNGTVNSTASGVASETTNILNTTVVLDGNYTYYVSCSDGVAITNSTSQSFIYDVTAPAINSTMPSEYNDTQITNNSFVLNVTITESYLNYSNLTITAPDGTIIFANQSTSLSFTEVVSLTGLPDGQYNASARALDLAGTLTTKNWFFTAARGRVSLVYPVNGTVYSRGNILVLEVNETQSTDTLANVTVTVNGTVYQALNDTVNGSNYWQYNYTIPVTMDSGQLNLTAMAYDSNGALRANASGYVLLNPNYSLFVSSRALYANGSTVNQTIVVRDANTNLVADATVSCARNNTAGSPASLNNGSYECLYASTVYGQYLLYANASKSGNFGNASTTTLVRQTNLAISISNLVKSSMAATNVTNSLVFPYDDLGHANGSVRFTFNMTDALNGSLVSGGFTFITYAHNGSVLVNDSGIISGVYTYNLTLDGIVPNISGMYAVSINVTDTDSMRAGLQTESNVSYWLAYVKYPTGIYVQGKPLPFNVTIWHNGTLMNVTNLTAVLHDNNGVEVTRETYPGQISAAGMGIYAGNFSTSGLTGGQNYFLSVSVYNLSVSDGAETAILAQDKDLDVTPETDTVAPGYSNLTNTTNVPERGEFINVSAYWTDNGQLSFSFLETNASGVLANVSNLTLSSNESYTNYSIDTSNLAYNTTVKWRLWVNDTSTVAAGGNWNFTPYYTFTVTDRTLPVNLGVSLSPQLVGVGNNVALRINASDNNNLSSVVAVVARPDGAMSLQLLSRISGNDTNATWEANITTSAAGRHNLTQVNITDTWGNVNSTNYTGQYFTVVVYSYLLGPGSYNTSADLNSTFNYMFMLNNTGTGNLTINISTNASWAVANESLVAVSNGSLSNFTVAFNLTNLTGNHTVQVIANGSSWAGMQSSNITIMIRQSGYTLVPASESVQVQSGAVENRTYMLSNTGTENLTINLTANASFAILNATQLNLTSGASANFSVSYDMSDLRGWHTVLVVANASGGAGVKSASVSLYAANSSYTYAPSTVALGLQAGEVRNVSYELNNTGTENLTLNLSTNVSWVVVNESQINLTAGSSRNFTVGYNSSGLMGSYPVLVYVNASNGLGERTSLAYLFVGVYNFTVSGGNVNVVLNNNTNHTTEDVNFTIINTGNSNLAMVCSSNLSWLTNQTACSGELAGGATRAVSYRLNATGVSEGVYSGQINVSDATAGLRQVNQTIAVTEIPIYTFTVAPSTEAFGVINDSYLDRNYELVNTGNRNVSVACASNSSWAYNTTACGGVLTSAQQQTVTFRYNAMGVAGGSYLTQINFTDSFGNASLQQVNGVITVSSAVYYSYTLVPDVDQFWQALGRNATHTYLISNVGNQPLVLGIASNESFAQLLNNSTVGLGVGGSYNFSVLYSTGSLANGTYLVTLNVSTGNQSLLSNITMTVLTANYTVSPGETVYVGAGEGQVQARQYVLNNTGSSNLTLVIGGNATFAAANESALTLSASGVQNITVTFNASGQPEGSQGLEFTVNDSTSASVRTLSLNLTVVSVSFISPPTPNEDSMSSYNNLTMNVSFSTALDSASVNNNGTDYAMSSGDGGLTWNATVSPLEEGRNGLSVTGIKNGMSVAGGNRTFYQNTTSVKAITFDYIGSNGSVINLSASGVSLAVPNTTTNFSQYDSSAVPNVTLVKYGVAVIIFNNSTSNLSGSILDGNVVLLSNNVMVNSSVLPALNRSAIIILYNLSHIQPIILRDGETCPSAICMQLSYSGGTLVFSVTQFSTYSTSEGYVAASGATGSGISGGKDRNIYSEFSPGCAGENLTVDYKTREPAELFVFVSGPYGEEVFSGRVQSNVNGSLVVVPKSIGEYKFYVRGEGYLESLKEVSVGSCGGAVMQVEPEPPKNASAGAVAVANASGGGLPQPQVNATVGGNYSWLLIVAGNYTVRANDLSSKGVDISELNGLLVRAKVVYVQKDYELAKGLLDEVEGELGRLESSVQSPESGVQSSGTQDPGPKTGYPQPETPAPGQDILLGLMAVTGLSSVMLAGIALLVIATIIVLYMLRKKKVI